MVRKDAELSKYVIGLLIVKCVALNYYINVSLFLSVWGEIYTHDNLFQIMSTAGKLYHINGPQVAVGIRLKIKNIILIWQASALPFWCGTPSTSGSPSQTWSGGRAARQPKSSGSIPSIERIFSEY